MTKLISWNVNGIRACAGKGFLDFSVRQMQMCSACRRQSFRQGSWSWICLDIISTGIMQRKKAIPALRFLPDRSPCP